MGNFIQIAIVKNCNKEQVENVLKQLEETETITNLVSSQCKFEEINKGTIVLLNEFCDGYHYLASILSEMLDTIVMVLYIYDGKSWSYCLCDNGEEIDQFSKDKEYLSCIEEFNKDISIGNLDIVCNCFSIKKEDISNYFKILEEEKAYKDDEYTSNDCWQMVDFMKKLGFPFKFNI